VKLGRSSGGAAQPASTSASAAESILTG